MKNWKQMLRRIIGMSLMLVLVMNLILPELRGVFAELWETAARAEVRSDAEAVASAEEPEAFSLEETPLGAERTAGGWRYALREDGYAVITGYDGDGGVLTVPETLGGAAVVGLASGALADDIVASIGLHGGIMFIAENAFGQQKPIIRALSGSYGLYFAQQHGMETKIASDYTFVPGVIDYTDMDVGSVKNRADGTVELDALEGMRLSEGSIFFFEDAQGADFFYRVTALEETGGSVIASVEIPEISDAIVEAHVDETHYFTADDFTAAAGVDVIESASSRAVTSGTSENAKIDLDIANFSKTFKNGNSISIGGTVSVSAKTSYVVDIQYGEIVYMSTEEVTTVKLTTSITGKVDLTDKVFGPTPSTTPAATLQPGDFGVTKELGKLKFYCGYFTTTFKVGYGAEVSGTLSAGITSTTVNRKHYDFDADSWVVDYERGNSSSSKDDYSIDAKIEGKIYISLTGTIAVFDLVSVIEMKVELGVKLSVGMTLKTSDMEENECCEIILQCYLKTAVTVGAWVNAPTKKDSNASVTIGAKITIWSQEYSHLDLLGLEPFVIHICTVNPLVHLEEECPFGERCSVRFDTRTGQLIEPATVFKGEAVPNLSEYHLADSDEYGKFLGWSEDPASLVATWVLGDAENYAVKQDMTLYAVWQIVEEVQFDSRGGTAVPSQFVPAGGYVSQPEPPKMEGNEFLYWYTIDEDGVDTPWNFGTDTVPENGVTLYAKWADGEVVKGGTTEIMYIGNRQSASDIPSDAQSGTDYLNWEILKDPDGNIMGVNISGVKNDPVDLVIPSTLTVPTGETVLGIAQKETLKVMYVYPNAFNGLNTLERIWFEASIGVDTEGMFEGCENLKYVDLSQTNMSEVQKQAFAYCPALECVKLPAGISTIGVSAFYGCSSLPEAVLLKGVSVVDTSAFYGCSKLPEMILPNTITKVGNAAFDECTSMEELYIPDSAKYAGESGQSIVLGCTALKKISIGGVDTIYAGSLRIGDGEEDKLQEIIIRSTVNHIGSYAFSSSTYPQMAYTSESASLRIFVEEGVETIGEGAFYNCSAVTSVSLPSTVTTIGEKAFKDCTRMNSFELGGTVYIGDNCFENCILLKNIYYGNRLRHIDSYAFLNCPSLTEMILPESVETIDSGAFDDCTAITDLYIPDKVYKISSSGYSIISGCTALETISIGGVAEIESGVFRIGSVPEDNLRLLHIRGSVGKIGDAAFSSSTTTSWAYNSDTARINVIIDDGVTEIGDRAFYYCTGITDVTIPKSVQTIGEYAFSNCTRLENVDTGGVQTIGSYAFRACTALNEPEWHGTLRTICSGAFEGCTNLKKMILPEGLETIESGAFSECTALEMLSIPDSTRSLPDSTIINKCSALRALSIGGVDTIENGTFRTGSIADDNLELLIIRGTVRCIGSKAFTSTTTASYAFDSTTADAKLVIAEGVEEIADYAFYRCTAFTEATLPDSLVSIGDYAFQNCTRLEKLNSGGAHTIGKYAFKGCTSLWRFDFGDSLRSIAASAFYGCSRLLNALLPEGVAEIGDSAFYGCSSMEAVYFPSTLVTVGSNVASGCTGLNSITVYGPETITSSMYRTGTSTDDKLQQVVIGGSVRNIGSYAFSSSSSSGYAFNSTAANARLVIEEGVETIDTGAFYRSTAFTEIVLPDSLTTLGARAFSNSTRATAVHIGSGVTGIGSNAFASCTALTAYMDGENSVVSDYMASASIPCEIGSSSEWTLTLDANGGSFDDGKTVSHTLAWMDELPQLEEPVNGYHLFCGWFIDADCTEPWVLNEMPARDLTLYAGWDIDVYPLTLNAMGGELNCSATLRVPAASQPVGEIVPEMEGCCFTGWYLDAACTELFDGYMPENNLTLYAGWATAAGNGTYSFADGEATLTRYQLADGESTSVYLPETVNGMPLTGIAANAFEYQEITELHLPASLLRMEENALSGMSGLETITVRTGSESFSAKNGVLFNHDGTKLLCYPAAKGTWYTIPNDVTEIADHAFENTDLQSLAFGGSLRRIGDYAFAGTGLVSLVLPAGVESIGDYAFYGCEYLAHVSVGEGLNSIGEAAFEYGGMIMMYGPEGTCALSEYAEVHAHLYNHYRLILEYGSRTGYRIVAAGAALSLPTDPDVGDNLRFTGWYSDEDCTQPWSGAMPHRELTLYAGSTPVFSYETAGSAITLTAYLLDDASVAVPASIDAAAVTAIAAGCFGSGVTRIDIPACVTTVADGAIPSGSGVTVVCPVGSAAETFALANGNTVARIEYSLSFEANGGLIPETIKAAEGSAIALPEPVRTGCEFAGWYADAELTEAVTLADGKFIIPGADTILYAAWTVTDEAAATLTFKWEQNGESIIITGAADGAADMIIPETLHGLPVTEIAEMAFAYNNEIISAAIPGSVEVIPESAFFNCRYMEKVTLGAGVKAIEANAFSGCRGLKEFDLPATMQRLESQSLAATAIESLTLGADFGWIAADALRDCADLKEIIVDSANESYSCVDGVLYGLTDNSLVKYPAGRTEESYTVADGTNVIAAEAFRGANRLKEIQLPDSVWSLGERAFAGCSRLEHLPVMTNEYLTQIPEECFLGCRGLTEIAIPENIAWIGSRAFASCSGLVSASIPEGVAWIGSMAFPVSGMQIEGVSGSYAEEYAEANGILFVSDGTVLPESVSLNVSALQLSIGETAQLTAAILPETATETAIVWDADDSGVVSVDDDGLVRALAGGTATVGAFTVNGLYALCSIEVDAAVPVEKLLLSSASLSLAAGETAQLTCTVLPSNASDPMVAWTSGNEGIATVDGSGLVTAIADGTTVITVAAADGITAQCVLTVGEAEKILAIAAPNSIRKNCNLRLQAVWLPDWTEAENASWSASDSDIAEIDENGVLRFKRAGYVTVTATVGDESCTLTLECAAESVLKLPSMLTEIGEESFLGCAAEKIVISKGAKTIGSRAFADSDVLCVVCIPASVTGIAEDAFSGSDYVCISAPKGSAAAQYAEAHGIRFMASGY